MENEGLIREEFDSIIKEFNSKLDEFFDKHQLDRDYSFLVHLDTNGKSADERHSRMMEPTKDGIIVCKYMQFRPDVKYKLCLGVR